MANDDQRKQALRKKAEARQREQSQNTRAKGPKEVLLDLEVHKIELEMQNEELRSVREQLEYALHRYEELFELAPVGYVTLDRRGVVGGANLRAASLLGVQREALDGIGLANFLAAEDQDVFHRHLRASFDSGSNQLCEVQIVERAGGILRQVQLESSAQTMGEAHETVCLTVLTDITDRFEQEKLIYHQANFDALTNLPNRSLFRDRLEYAVLNAGRESQQLALFFIDLDNFKWINDTHGHAAGDVVLRETAVRLNTCARKSDTVGRLSGDEFCIILPNVAGKEAAALVAGKVLSSLDRRFPVTDGVELRVGCSIGIALYPGDGVNADDLLKSADIALYQVKRRGRGHFEFFTARMDAELIRQQRLALNFGTAIENDELTLRYQPIVDLKNQRVHSVEALVRWRHPENGLLEPDDFLPILEASGSIIGLDGWVLTHVAAQLDEWRQGGSNLDIVWVNLSARQYTNLESANRLAKLLAQLTEGETTPRLGLEITESGNLSTSDGITGVFARIHQQGIALSVDDFGTGYTSLERLLNLPVDLVKIDKSFISEIGTSENYLDLLRSVVALGHSLGAKLVAEGIETKRQLDTVRAVECDLGQGFYLAEPLTAEQLETYLAEHALG